VKNKFLVAIHDIVPKDELFDKRDILRQQFYSAILEKNKIKKVNGYYYAFGFRSCIEHFESNIFIENYGLEYIKNPHSVRVVIDCGAFIGDSVFIFQKLRPLKIVAIEPDIQNFLALEKNIKLNNWTNVLPLRVGVGATKNHKSVVSIGSITYLNEGNNVEVTSIDNIVEEYNLNEVNLIKMDIEGMELDAIKGARATIEKFKPILIISIYHRGQDFFEIPKFIKSIRKDYSLRFVNLNAATPIFERVLIVQ